MTTSQPNELKAGEHLVPSFDMERCTLCGDCIAACPVDCLEFWNLPVLARSHDCISCGICEMICPDDAVNLTATALSFDPLRRDHTPE